MRNIVDSLISPVTQSLRRGHARRPIGIAVASIALLLGSGMAAAHGVDAGDAAFIQANGGRDIAVFVYLGAKHMVTGYDHLLFLLGIVFFLYRARDVATYVSLFALGHSVTLLAGVLSGLHVNAYIVDAVIGLSVVYKALDNLGGFDRWALRPNPRAAVFGFGLVHGLGLATKLQDFELSGDGLVANILAFNLGVEVGQLLALGAILIAMGLWRRSRGFARHAAFANTLLMAAGFVLIGYQLVGFALSR